MYKTKQMSYKSSIVSSVAWYSNVTVYCTAITVRLLGVMYHSVCAVITVRLMICCHATLFFTLLVVMFLPVIQVISAL